MQKNNRPSWWPKGWTEWEVGQHLQERSEALQSLAKTRENKDLQSNGKGGK